MGLLTDFLGSMAQTGGSMLEQDRRRQEEEAKEARLIERQKAMADYTADLNMKKQALLEALREEREAGKQKAFVEANDQAEEGMLKIGNDRRFQSFKAKLGQTDATDEELKPAFDQYYNNKAVQVGDKADTQFVDKKRTDAAGDFYKAARETGNTELVKSAKDQVAQAQKMDADDAKDARERAEIARKEKRDEARAEADAERLELGYRRLESAVGRGSREKPEDPLKERTAIRNDIKELESTMPKPPDTSKLVGRMKADAEKEYNTKLEAWKQSDDGKLVQQLRARQQELMSNKASESKPAGGQSKPISTLPPGSKQIGTSNGKPVYQTPDGKKFIAK